MVVNLVPVSQTHIDARYRRAHGELNPLLRNTRRALRLVFSRSHESQGLSFPTGPHSVDFARISTWGHDAYKGLHLLDFLLRVCRQNGVALENLSYDLSAINSLVRRLDLFYLDENSSPYSKNVTEWFHRYYSRFTPLWDFLLRKMDNMLSNPKELLIIRDFGCATGEETYVLAMLVCEAASRVTTDVSTLLERTSVVGYSIVPLALKLAEEAVFLNFEKINYPHKEYYSNSIPDPSELLSTHIVLGGKRALVDERIIQMVRFNWINLLDETDLEELAKEKADVVVCCRTLYFDHIEKGRTILPSAKEARVWKALVQFGEMLNPEGMLIIDETPVDGQVHSSLCSRGFIPVPSLQANGTSGVYTLPYSSRI